MFSMESTILTDSQQNNSQLNRMAWLSLATFGNMARLVLAPNKHFETPFLRSRTYPSIESLNK